MLGIRHTFCYLALSFLNMGCLRGILLQPCVDAAAQGVDLRVTALAQCGDGLGEADAWTEARKW